MKHLINHIQQFNGALSAKIEKGRGKRLVIPDIHGCSNTFKELIEKVAPTKDDQLFFLGDYIDRGVDSSGVLKYLNELSEKGYQVFPIRGNHEQMLLDASEYPGVLQAHARKENVKDLITSKGTIIDEYRHFIEILPHFYDLEDFLLVHAGFNFRSQSPFEDYEEMLWIRDWKPEMHWLGNKRVIHGHTPVYKEISLEAIHNEYPVIPLDNGCVFSQGDFNQNYGTLLCLNLDSLELISQPNLNDIVF